MQKIHNGKTMSDLNSLAPDNRDLSMFPGEYGLPFLGKTVEFVKDTLAMCNSIMRNMDLFPDWIWLRIKEF